MQQQLDELRRELDEASELFDADCAVPHTFFLDEFRRRYPFPDVVDTNKTYTDPVTDQMCNVMGGHYRFDLPYLEKPVSVEETFKSIIRSLGAFTVVAENILDYLPAPDNRIDRFPFFVLVRQWQSFCLLGPKPLKLKQAQYSFAKSAQPAEQGASRTLVIDTAFVKANFPVSSRAVQADDPAPVAAALAHIAPWHFEFPSPLQLARDSIDAYNELLRFLAREDILAQLALADHQRRTWVNRRGRVIKERGEVYAYP